MAKYEEMAPLDYRVAGDTVDDFAQKYMKEIPRIYQFLNNIREMNSTGPYQIEPQPNQLKAEDGKIYIRNADNTNWICLGEIKLRFGLTPSLTDRILTDKDLAQNPRDPDKIITTNKQGVVDIDISGNAARIANKLIKTQDIKDGETLVYREGTGCFVNETNTQAASKLVSQHNNDIYAHPHILELIPDNVTGISSATRDLQMRVSHNERLIGDVILQMDAQKDRPDGDAYMVENFDDPDMIDLAEATITSIMQGDDSIDVTTGYQLLRVGLNYVLTDGEVQEAVKIKSISPTASGTCRAILFSPIKNQYDSGRARLYRSNIILSDGKVYAGGNLQTNVYEPKDGTFDGKAAPDIVKTIDYSDTSAFTVIGGAVINGRLSIGSPAIGIALVQTGNRTGTWAQVNGEGDDLV